MKHDSRKNSVGTIGGNKVSIVAFFLFDGPLTSSVFNLSENKRLLQEAKLALKRSKRKDFYKILGVAKEATDDEIKKAYKKRALLHHPGTIMGTKFPKFAVDQLF